MNDSIQQPKPEAIETEPALSDHEYDGIQEYDNPLPGWWKAIFWATVVFALGYVVFNDVSQWGRSVAEEYAAEEGAARAIQAKRALAEDVSEASLIKLMVDAATVAEAKLLYQQSCQVCHNQEGTGLIGPNLTDDYWIHGKGTLMDIHTVVKTGVIASGMPSWDRQLTPIELRKVVAYVGTLRGKHLQGKAPQGDKIADLARP
jgi:cytochrome c oxidase cbb3-type subunit III